MIESLQKYHHYYGDSFQIELPRYSGQWVTLDQAANNLARRLINIFARDGMGRRPVYGGSEKFQHDPYWRDHLLFYEYFHGDNGAGIGASHQTGWTCIVARLVHLFGTTTPEQGLALGKMAVAGPSTAAPKPAVKAPKPAAKARKPASKGTTRPKKG